MLRLLLIYIQLKFKAYLNKYNYINIGNNNDNRCYVGTWYTIEEKICLGIRSDSGLNDCIHEKCTDDFLYVFCYSCVARVIIRSNVDNPQMYYSLWKSVKI